MLKNVYVSMITNLLFLLIFCTLTTALETGNSYSAIIGRVKNINQEKEMITIVMETKKDGIREFNIKIGKGMNYIFVRDNRGLLSVDSFKELKLGDNVSIKCKGTNGEYETVEIEKMETDKVAKFIEVEGSAVIEASVDKVDGDEIAATIEKAGFSFVEEE